MKLNIVYFILFYCFRHKNVIEYCSFYFILSGIRSCHKLGLGRVLAGARIRIRSRPYSLVVVLNWPEHKYKYSRGLICWLFGLIVVYFSGARIRIRPGHEYKYGWGSIRSCHNSSFGYRRGGIFLFFMWCGCKTNTTVYYLIVVFFYLIVDRFSSQVTQNAPRIWSKSQNSQNSYIRRNRYGFH